LADGFHIDIEGQRELEQQLEVRSRLLSNPAPLLDRMGLYMMRSVRKNFQEGGRPIKWTLSHSAKTDGTNTLMPTGRTLLASIAYEVAGKSFRLGTNHPGARLLNFGGIVKPKAAKALVFNIPGVGTVFAKKIVMPERKFILIHSTDARRMVKMADQAIQDMRPSGEWPDREMPA